MRHAGPWRVVSTPEGDFGIASPGSKHLIAIVASSVSDPEGALNNARLMAAAPQLLELTILLAKHVLGEVPRLQTIDDTMALMRRIDSTISKATGK